MGLLAEHERGFLEAVSKLAYCNPFLPEFIELEREALGPDYRLSESIWSMQVDGSDPPRPSLKAISDRLEALVAELEQRLAGTDSTTDRELELYEDAVLFMLYRRYEEPLYEAIEGREESTNAQAVPDCYQNFLEDWRKYFQVSGLRWRTRYDAAHLFACFFQVRRAFNFIFRYIIGGSSSAGRLRATVWQSIFTHDMRRYRDTLYERLGDITTLVTGPSGTGKELVARAIGLSRYIPFDAKKRSFAGEFATCFHALNLSALPSTLIESELFGHRRGAFTGALQDRRGWMAICEPWGAVFLDEIGDLDISVQVKLLRVLQTRTFQPVGETSDFHFRGKIIAATNRDLDEAMRNGDLREDFYYRLCSDVIVTPSLQDQVKECPQELRELILFIAREVAGSDSESLADEVEAWVAEHLGLDYPWPGNIRELEQCVRSILVHKEYHPTPARTRSKDLAEDLIDGDLTAEELLRRYCTVIYARTGSYGETARRLELDRRTVKSRIDPDLLERLRVGED